MTDLFASAGTDRASRGPVEGEAWSPELVGAGRGVPVTQVDRREPFLLMAHPQRWGVVNGKLRPILGRLKLSTGVSGVEAGRDGAIRAGGARVHYEERGWELIPHSTLPPSQAHRGSYLMRPRGRSDVALAYWEQVFAGSTVIRCDEVLRDEFLDYLVDAGIISPPMGHVVDGLLDAARSEHSKLLDRARTQPSAAPLAKDAGARLKVLEKAIAAIRKDDAGLVPSEVDAFDPEAEA